MNADILEFEGRSQSDFWFACVDLSVIRDTSLSPRDLKTYCIICSHADVQTRSWSLRIKTLADESGCSIRTIQESLEVLIERGVIERIERFKDGKQMPSMFRIVGRQAKCYQAPPHESQSDTGAKNRTGAENCGGEGAKNCTPLLESFSYENQRIKDTPSGEPPAPAAPKIETPPPASAEPCPEESDLISPEDVPAAMKECTDYFLLKTGRAGIRPDELSAVRELEKIHTPQRVNREISKAVERYEKKNRPLSELTLTYIYESLKFQTSGKSGKNNAPPAPRKQNKYDEGCLL